MRVAVLVIGLILMIVVGFQSCLVATGEVILEGFGEEELASGGGAIGMFAAFLLGIAAAFALGKPFVSIVIFVLAALIAFMAGSTGFSDMNVWGVFALILALLSFLGLPDPKNKIKVAVKKWWFWVIVGLVFIIIVSTCINGKEEGAEKKEQQTVATKATKSVEAHTDQFVIQVGSKSITVNDMELTLDAPVREIEWQSYMPLRFFLDWFGAEDVTYDRATEVITFKLNRHSEIDPAVIEKYLGKQINSSDSQTTYSTKQTQETSPQKENQKKTDPLDANKKMVSDIQIHLKGAYYSYGDDFIGPDKGNKWIVLDLELENFSNESISISSLMMFELIDQENYKADYALNINQRGSLDGELGIGRKMAGEITFEVPENHHQFEFIFKPKLFGKNQAIFKIDVK